MMPVELNNIQKIWQAFPVPFLSPLFSQEFRGLLCRQYVGNDKNPTRQNVLTVGVTGLLFR